MRSSVVLRILAVLVGLDGLAHAIEAARGAHDPRILLAEHVLVFVSAVVAAVGLWRGSRWSPWALAAFGIITAVLVVSLGPLLALDHGARSGLWTGAATIVVLTAVAVWYANRRVASPSLDV